MWPHPLNSPTVGGGVKVSKGVKRGVPGVKGSLGDPRGLRGVSEVYEGLKEAPGIYNKRVVFCKIYFLYFARDKWWDHDCKNCSEIRLVTRIRKMWVQSQIWRQWLEIGVLQDFKTTSAFCKLRLPNFARDESSNQSSENCSEISAVTRFGICLELLHFPTFMFFTPPYYSPSFK